MEKYEEFDAYIDGGLSAESESAFFIKLASDDEMRLKLKQMMDIRNVIASNTSIFTPPAESTSKIFSALGIHQPAAVSTGFNYKKAAKYALTLFLGMLLTSAVYYFLVPAKEVTRIINRNTVTDENNHDSKSNGLINYPVVSSKDISDLSFKSASLKNQKVPENVLIEPIDKSETNNAVNINQQNENESDIVGINNSKPEFVSELLSGWRQREIIRFAPIVNDFEAINPSGGKFRLELFGSQYFLLPQPEISPARYSLFNNNGLAALWEIDDELSAGLEIRQETFYQEFWGMNRFGIIEKYYQQPNFTTISLIGKYYFADFSNFKPYLQANLGANRGGYVYRGTAGLEFSPYDYIGFLLAFEYSKLLFYHADNWFDSEKVGIKYGVKVKF